MKQSPNMPSIKVGKQDHCIEFYRQHYHSFSHPYDILLWLQKFNIPKSQILSLGLKPSIIKQLLNSHNLVWVKEAFRYLGITRTPPRNPVPKYLKLPLLLTKQYQVRYFEA